MILSQRRRLLVHKAMTRGRYTGWDFQPHQDATRTYVRNTGDILGDLERATRLPPLTDPTPDGPGRE